MIASGMPKSDDAQNLVQNHHQDTEAPRTLATGSPRGEDAQNGHIPLATEMFPTVQQYKRWLSDDPPRIHQIRPEIDRWREHFKLSKVRPMALDDFDKAGTEKLVWWREFLIETKQINARDVHHT
jgi:hypothetical protein